MAGTVAYGVTRPAEKPASSASDMQPVKSEVHTLALSGQERAAWAKGRPAAGVARSGTEPFSMLGVTWGTARDPLKGAVAVRTRSTSTGAWSPWRKLELGGDAPDSRSPERSGSRGGTAPLWVGPSDGVEVRVLGRARGGKLPGELRVDLVDPGDNGRGRPSHAGPKKTPTRNPHNPKQTATPTTSPTTAPGDPQPTNSPPPTTASASPTSSPSAPSATPTPTVPEATTSATPTTSASPPPSQPPAPTPTVSEPSASAGPTASQSATAPASPSAPGTPSPTAPTTTGPAPRPAIAARAQWGADESLVKAAPDYDQAVKAVFVHHTDTGNDYTCDQSAQVIRSIFTYHVTSLGWNDIGYNFLIDKCGTLFEGRAGGVDRPVHGAHTYGFNTDTTGVAVLGTYISVTPTQAVQNTIAKVAAWKLGLTGQNPAGKVTLTSLAPTGTGKYAYGTKVTLNTISGHRDGYATECPGEALYAELPAIRTAASAL
ncbi:peptidoglycan recognition protein [Actinomadura chokoriensis]|uniref:peptidoglycan recognition protein family protein n=1 Tax=Actinomadura chokoriensis TaxID=454156 RepID=UPI0031F75AC7